MSQPWGTEAPFDKAECKGCLKQLKWPSGKSGRLGSSRLGFDSELMGQTNDFKIGIHSFHA